MILTTSPAGTSLRQDRRNRYFRSYWYDAIIGFHLGRSVRRYSMREGISIEVSAADCERLAAVVADRNSPQKHVWRARIILATAEGCGTAEIMRRAGVSKPCVWRWQERFMREGVAGLLHDKTRKPGLPPTPAAVIDRVVELTLAEPPGETTHWTGRAMAAVTGLSLRSVQRIWAAHGLQPHRVRRFKLSQDPAFAAKLRDVVGLYLDPPAHSLVLSVDEKSQIQSLPLARTGALDRTQPGLPIKKGRAGTMTRDYIRNSLPPRKRGARRRCSRRSMSSMARSSANAWRATATRNSSASSIGSRPLSRPASLSTLFSTTTPFTNIPRSAPGSLVTHAGRFTSPQPRAPGPMPLKAFLPPSPAGGCSVASSARWSICKPRSTAISASITANPSPSSGPPIPTASSKKSTAGTK